MRNLAGALLTLALVVSFAASTAKSAGIFFETELGHGATATATTPLCRDGRETLPTLAGSGE